MSLIFTESFDGVTSGARRWTYWRPDNLISTTYGRDGTKGLRSVTINGIHELCHYTFPTLVDEAAVGAWVYWEGGDDADDVMLQLRSNGGDQYTLRPDPVNKQLLFNEVAIGSALSFQTDTWYFVEMKVKPAVSIEVRLNEATIHSAVAGGAGKVASLYIIMGGGLGVSGAYIRYDNLYILDTSGSAPFNDFLGLVKISVDAVDADGSLIQLSGSDGNSVDNYALVSDNNDATYVEGTPTEGDLYSVGAVGFTEDLLGAMVIVSAEDMDFQWLTTLPIKSLVKVGVTTYESPPIRVGSKQGLLFPWPQNPDSASAWAISEIEAAEWGVEVGL